MKHKSLKKGCQNGKKRVSNQRPFVKTEKATDSVFKNDKK
jgi:hypothetical protein